MIAHFQHYIKVVSLQAQEGFSTLSFVFLFSYFGLEAQTFKFPTLKVAMVHLEPKLLFCFIICFAFLFYFTHTQKEKRKPIQTNTISLDKIYFFPKLNLFNNNYKTKTFNSIIDQSQMICLTKNNYIV